jgi:dsDNA-specific endonuclease/ATPase MutS2
MKSNLDLHGFKTEDVVAEVDRFIYGHQQAGTAKVEIMTGKGTGKVQKVVIDYLKKAGYHWEFKKMPSGSRNEGVLVIFMT